MDVISLRLELKFINLRIKRNALAILCLPIAKNIWLNYMNMLYDKFWGILISKDKSRPMNIK